MGFMARLGYNCVIKLSEPLETKNLKRHTGSWIALAVGLVLTMVASLEVKQSIEQNAADELAFTSDQVTLKIQDRLEAYALTLKGGAGLFAASNAVDRRAWRAYVETLRTQDSLPGVQGIGFSQVIPPHQLAAHIARIRAEGFPDYTVYPAGERALYTAIIYLEPFRDRNLRAFGFDMFSEPVRRAAMEQARDSGAPALSGKVELVQETGTEVQAGTLIYVPVYRNGAATDTVEQRRAALIGWSYSPYRMQDLMGGILDNWDDHITKRVDLNIYAGSEVQADSLLYESQPAVPHEIDKIDPFFYQERTIDFNGQHWLLAFHPVEGVAPVSYATAWATLAAGILLSSLLCGLMLALARTQVRAREIADSLTEDLRRIGDSLRESEAALQSFTRDFEAFLHQTSDFVYFKDADSRIRFCSKTLADITGHRHWREMVGKHDRELFPPDTAKIYEEEEAPVFAEGRPLLNKVDPYYDKDGRTGYVETNKWPLFDDDKTVVGIFGISRDITERKRAEAEKLQIQAQLTQAQKSESLGRMAGAIAHTFNNQLSVVIGNLEMAIEELPRDAKPLPLLTDAMQGARKAAEVSGLMLTYLGKTNSLHVPLDLSESCRKSLPLLQAGDSHGIILKVNLPSPGPTISANANQIQQAYTNLINNAREAIGEKQGMVTLTVKTVPQTDISTVNRYPLDWQAQNATYACLEVTDTGCGIANECLDKIFDPFYSTKFLGRGLGLPIVSGIASAHGGVITVASEEHGSTFRLFLPLSTEEIPRQTVETVQPIVSKGRGTVLLIDDEEMIRNMTKTMLMSLDYKVLAAKDGIEAVEIFARGQDEIRCVVSDLTMPRMNGWKTLAALRKLSPDIPVILSSGYDEAQVLIGDHPERPQAFLHKPYNMNELKAALAKAMED